MNITAIVLNQIIVMLLLIGVGVLCGKLKLVTMDGAGQLSNILLKIVVPCVIFKSFLMPFDNQKLTSFGLACLFGFIAHFICMGAGTLLFRKKQDGLYKVQRFALTFSNCGFMAIPIVSAVLGDEGVFFSSAFLIANNALTYSYGVVLLSTEKKAGFRSTFKKCITNPAIVSILVGLVVFICRIPVPQTINAAAGFFEAMNTPLAMLILGVYMFHSHLLAALKNKKVYTLSALRLIAAPLAMLLIFALLVRLFPGFLSDNLIIANLIAAACPCAVTVTILTAQYMEQDHCRDLALSLVVVTTLFSMATIGLMVFFGGFLIGFS